MQTIIIPFMAICLIWYIIRYLVHWVRLKGRNITEISKYDILAFLGKIALYIYAFTSVIPFAGITEINWEEWLLNNINEIALFIGLIGFMNIVTVFVCRLFLHIGLRVYAKKHNIIIEQDFIHAMKMENSEEGNDNIE